MTKFSISVPQYPDSNNKKNVGKVEINELAPAAI